MSDAVADPITAHKSKAVPAQLWHYTSMAAMQGIIDSGEMYATDARFLNDADELIHAAKYTDDFLSKESRDPRVVDFVRYQVAEAFKDLLSLSNPYRNYVTCFTTLEDDLSQWRAYSHGSAGISLAFDFRSLGSVRTLLAPCIYEDEEKKAMLLFALKTLFEVAEAHLSSDPRLLLIHPDPLDELDLSSELKKQLPLIKQNINLATAKLWLPFITILPLFKNRAFKAEEEWRIVRLQDESSESLPLFFRARQDSLVPTLKLNVKNGAHIPLTGIRVGPGSHPHAEDAIKRYVRSKWMTVDVIGSDVPYRSA
jgi:hypothetical protein